MHRFNTVLALVTLLSAPTAAQDFPVTISVDANELQEPLVDVWRSFGADEPNYAYMKDGRKLLGQLGNLKPNDVYLRTHNLMTTGPGTPALKWGSTNLYTEDERGNPSTTGASST